MVEERVIDAYKRCPDCMTKVQHETTKCPECGQRLGAADKRGIARKPPNYVGYFLFIAAMVGLYFFVKKYFFE